MNAASACSTCSREIPSASTHVVTGRSTVLCAVCVEGAEGRSAAYPECPAASHGVDDDPVAVRTRLGAHRALMRMRRGQEVASSA